MARIGTALKHSLGDSRALPLFWPLLQVRTWVSWCGVDDPGGLVGCRCCASASSASCSERWSPRGSTRKGDGGSRGAPRAGVLLGVAAPRHSFFMRQHASTALRTPCGRVTFVLLSEGLGVLHCMAGDLVSPTWPQNSDGQIASVVLHESRQISHQEIIPAQSRRP